MLDDFQIVRRKTKIAKNAYIQHHLVYSDLIIKLKTL